MKRYFVKSLSVLGKNNKKYEAGQEVKASNFEEGVIDILVKEEHLEVVEVIDETEIETPIVDETENETETAVEIVEEKPIETPIVDAPTDSKKSTKKSSKTNTSDFVD
jgi:hypothetical protein